MYVCRKFTRRKKDRQDMIQPSKRKSDFLKEIIKDFRRPLIESKINKPNSLHKVNQYLNIQK